MRVTAFNVAFAFLALCGNGQAGPCKPKSTSAAIDGPSSIGGVTSASTQGTTSASTTVSTTAEESSAVESLTSYSSAIISEPVSSIITTTSDALLSYPTELSLLSETTETSDTTASTTELATEPLTTSNTAETTTSDVPISTTTEGPAPSNLFLNPSFEEPSIDGEVDGTSWIVEDGPVSSVRISPDIARTGSHSAYWSIATHGENGGTIKQEISLEEDHVYKLSYWWYIDEEVQPQNLESCQITVAQEATNGLTSVYHDEHALSPPPPLLKTWTKREFLLDPIRVNPTYMIFGVYCTDLVGTGFKIAIDDIQLFY